MRYHTCPASCLVPGNWSATMIGLGSGLARGALVLSGGAVHAFFADGTGGVSYLRCTAGCTAAAGWSGESLEPPGSYGHRVAFAIARSGRIHALYQDLNLTALRYATCATACTAAASWARTTIGAGLDARNLVLAIDGNELITGVVEDFATGNLRLVP